MRKIEKKFKFSFLSSFFYYCVIAFPFFSLSFPLIFLNTEKTHIDNTNDNNNNSTKLPYYLKVPTTVIATEGSNVILSCRIENLGDRMVFWIRNADLQILTAGLTTFSSDSRFKVNHENSVDEKDWSLLITDVRREDEALYECQIATDPKMKLNVNLLVKGENQ